MSESPNSIRPFILLSSILLLIQLIVSLLYLKLIYASLLIIPWPLAILTSIANILYIPYFASEFLHKKSLWIFTGFMVLFSHCIVYFIGRYIGDSIYIGTNVSNNIQMIEVIGHPIILFFSLCLTPLFLPIIKTKSADKDIDVEFANADWDEAKNSTEDSANAGR